MWAIGTNEPDMAYYRLGVSAWETAKRTIDGSAEEWVIYFDENVQPSYLCGTINGCNITTSFIWYAKAEDIYITKSLIRTFNGRHQDAPIT